MITDTPGDGSVSPQPVANDPFMDALWSGETKGCQPSESVPTADKRPNCAPERNADGTPRRDYRGLKLPGGQPTVETKKVAVCDSPGPNEFRSAATQSEGRKPVYILPSGDVSYDAFANICFHDLGKMGVLFMQGDRIVEVIKDADTGRAQIVEVTVSGLRSRIEKLGILRINRKRGEDYLLAPHGRCSEETAKALYASDAPRRHLPKIALTVNCPLITNDAL